MNFEPKSYRQMLFQKLEKFDFIPFWQPPWIILGDMKLHLSL